MIYLTGSCPCPPQGWQEAILLSVKKPPLKGPYFLMAWIPYSEHDGMYLHEGLNKGEITPL